MTQSTGWRKSGLGRLMRWLLIAAGVLILGACLFYALSVWMFLYTPAVSHHALLVDIDNDSDLDAVLANGINEGQTESTIWVNQGGLQGGQPGHFAVSSQKLGSAEYHTLAAGDLDGDGDADLLLGNTWYGIEIFINQGGSQAGTMGQFNRAGRLEGDGMWGGTHPISLGDLDQDGDLDVLSANCCGGLMQLGNGGAQAMPVFQPIPAYGIIFVNQTNIVTVPSAVPLEPAMSWVLEPTLEEKAVPALRSQVEGPGSAPSFEGIRVPAQTLDGTSALVLGDLDGDGDLDVFLAKTAQIVGPGEAYGLKTAYRVWWNTTGQAGIAFTDSGLFIDSPNVADIALGDLDGDGDLDALAATDKGGQVLLNQAGKQGGKMGDFALMAGRLGSQRSSGAFLGDLNGDGSLDVLLALPGQAQVWLNDGQGNFALRQSNMRVSEYHAFALGDVDKDGDLDIFAGRLKDDYKVWLNDGHGKFTRQ